MLYRGNGARYNISYYQSLIESRIWAFDWYQNSVTLNDFERRNNPDRCVISSNSAAFGADYVKVVEFTLDTFSGRIKPPFGLRGNITLFILGSLYMLYVAAFVA